MNTDSSSLLTIDEALDSVRAHATTLPPRRHALAEALGCTLAEDVAADLDLPPFDKALVDGYAVRSADFESSGQGHRLRVGEEILAGRTPTRPLAAGEAAAIMTGAPLPEGADAVIMVERTQRDGDSVVIDAPAPRAGQNRLCRGREMRKGDVVLRRGDRLGPVRLGLLASIGRGTVDTLPRPLVAVGSTGDELVEPHRVPGPGQIRNSNAVTLWALVAAAGADADTLPIAPDEPEALRAILARGLTADVLTITGGVSAGSRDLVPAALEALGVTRVFHKVRLKPGKPLWFGVGPARPDGPGTLVFGLPGNPVSGVVGFLLFVRPALRILAGLPDTSRDRSRLPLARSFRHSSDRPTYHPARHLMDSGQNAAAPLDWAGSADLRTVAAADGFVVLPAGERDYEAGDVVEFLHLS